MVFPLRYLLLVLAAAVLFVLALHSPPDGLERGDWAQFFGRFHPLLVHFPIALLLLVPILELAGRTQKWKQLGGSGGFVLWLSTVAVLIAVTFGWLLGWSGGYEGGLVKGHMWGGIALAGACLLCGVLRAWNRSVYAVALVMTLGLLAWTSDQGGKLTHGQSYLTQKMPASLQDIFGVSPSSNSTKSTAQPATVPPSASAPGSAPTSPRTESKNMAAGLSPEFFASRVEPILSDKCVQCHGPEKHKAKLRLDSYDLVLLGGKDGPVVKPGDLKQSEMIRRVNLPSNDDDFMPADGKPPLTRAEIKILELWVAGSASEQAQGTAVAGIPSMASAKNVPATAVPDYRSESKQIAALQETLGLQLVARSQNPADGLILRTISNPEKATDEALAQLRPIARYIVDAELARTKISNSGLRTLSEFRNLRVLDVSYTGINSAGLAPLAKLEKLENLNLTGTDVDDQGVNPLRRKSTLKRIYVFETRCAQTE